MNDQKRKQLEEAGFKVGSVADFLNLTEEQQREIDEALAELDRIQTSE